MVLISSKIFHLTYTLSLIVSLSTWSYATQTGSPLSTNFGTWIGYWFIQGISTCFVFGMRRNVGARSKPYYQNLLASFPSLPLILIASEAIRFIWPDLSRFTGFVAVALITIIVYALCYKPLKDYIGQELEQVFNFQEQPRPPENQETAQ